MNILLLSTFELQGGAAIACKRLQQALEKQGVSVKMLVRDKQTDDEHVYSIYEKEPKWLGKLRFLWERFVIWLHNGFSRENLFAVSIANTGYRIDRHPLVKWADIIHLHWTNQGFLSLGSIAKLSSLDKPIVWTMHDMWPFTGICHHARHCNHFMSRCSECFFLQKKKHDLSEKKFIEKRELIFSNSNIRLIACSHWLLKKAQSSNLSINHCILSIPNPINISIFKSNNKIDSRRRLGLPQDKKMLLFGAANLTDQRKGLSYLVDAIIKLNLLKDVCLVVFGQAKEEFISLIQIPVYSMGYLSQADDIVCLYNAVNVFITPSLEENLPNTIMEAMACGTPCVGFDVGGIPEMIDHRKNGYVAEYKNADDLANGIRWILEEADPETLSKNARKKVEQSYSEEVVAKQHIALYHSLLS
ncbi:glycosyltransferase [Tannerella forsythia]|uniref:Glycosyltransferase n=1 Tax=Tannerella forsythia TaxID=28112 RepID=A0A3P1YV08_TANFO|nr:glycosyltransferase [Tannerella forsythia]RRD74568.1 glycosyltransferase [Tannerella forsythia]